MNAGSAEPSGEEIIEVDGGQPMRVLGTPRTVIALTGKDGLLRLFDRDSRMLVYSVTTRDNADVPLTTEHATCAPACSEPRVERGCL